MRKYLLAAEPAIFGLDMTYNPKLAESARLANVEAKAAAARQYELFETAFKDRLFCIDGHHLRRYASMAWLHPAALEIEQIKTISMLHTDVLMLLRLFALCCQGPVLEIGPYIGGSTLSIGHGLQASGDRRRRLVSVEIGSSVEIGGVYESHPHIPTKDIVRDLKRNIDKAGLTKRVDLLVGHSRDDLIATGVKQRAREQKYGLCFIDADGDVEADWAIYSECLRSDAVIAFDDYTSEYAEDKAAKVKPWVDKMVAHGAIRSFGVFGWGTWFGQRVP